MSWLALRPEIRTLLESETLLQEVKGFPTLKFTGYPGAYVVPSTNESDYETTTENERVYAFLVRVFYETKDGGIENALIALEGAVDSIMDAVDEDSYKGADRVIGVDLPAKYTYLHTYAINGEWGTIEEESLVFTELTIRVHLSVDITS